MATHHRTRAHGQRAQTKFIQLDRHLCQACWKCMEVCPDDVFGKIDMLFGLHQHVRLDRPEQCKGCKKCVLACPAQAIIYIYRPPVRTVVDRTIEENTI